MDVADELLNGDFRILDGLLLLAGVVVLVLIVSFVLRHLSRQTRKGD